MTAVVAVLHVTAVIERRLATMPDDAEVLAEGAESRCCLKRHDYPEAIGKARAVGASSLDTTAQTSCPRGRGIVRLPWASSTMAERDKEPRTPKSVD